MVGLHLVTGGSGYFGSALVACLRAAGRRVRVFDLIRNPDLPSDVDMVVGDIRDFDAVRRACADVEIAYHNVAQVPLAKDRKKFFEVNQVGTGNLLRGARQAGIRKVVHTSSSAVFGIPERNPVDEGMVPKPQEDYGRAKLGAEDLCRAAADEGLSVTIVRPRTIMGHGRLGIMQILFEWVRQGRNIPVLGRGDNRYQFVHADDLADAIMRAAARPASELFHVGAERFDTMRATLEALAAHAGTGSRVVSVPLAPAELLMKLTSLAGLSPLGPYHSLMYGRSMFFDVGRAKALLGWTPRWSNAEMFCQSYDWYLAHRDEVMCRTGSSPHTSPVRQGILALASRFLDVM